MKKSTKNLSQRNNQTQHHLQCGWLENGRFFCGLPPKSHYRFQTEPTLGRRWWGIVGMLLLLFVVVGCDGPDAPTVNEDEALLAGNELRPVEEEQIENVVTAYFQRDSATPAYVVNIEQVEDAWARVSMRPEGVENTDDVILYLQKQSATAIEAPTAEPDTATGNIGPVDTTSGWTIILGPQAQFSEEELDDAGIPPFIRSG